MKKATMYTKLSWAKDEIQEALNRDSAALDTRSWDGLDMAVRIIEEIMEGYYND